MIIRKLAGIENALVDQVAAVAEDDTHDGLDEKGHGDVHQRRHPYEGDIDFFIFLIQLLERK